MATIPFNKSALDDLVRQRDTLASELGASKTGYDYSGGAKPTSSDIYKDAQLKALNTSIDQMLGQQKSEQWYGKGKAEESFTTGKENQGLFSKTIDVISAPLRSIVGAVQGITGTGPKKGILESMKYNAMTGKATFGDVMEKAGVPKVIAMPVGFATDIAFDPVNWLTAGTSALIPRVVTGLLKGGVRAGAAGATSRLGQIALQAADLPLINRLGIGSTEAAQKLGVKAIQEAGLYNKLTGINKLETLGQGVWTPVGRSMLNVAEGEAPRTIGAALQKKAEEIFGTKFVHSFLYSPMERSKLNKLMDMEPGIADEALRVFGEGKKVTPEDIDAFFDKFSEAAAKNGVELDILKSRSTNFGKSHSTIAQEGAEKILREADTAANTGKARILDDARLADEMENVASEVDPFVNEMRKYARYKGGETGWDWYDTKAAALSSRVKEIRREGQFRKDLVEMGDDLKRSGKSLSEMDDMEKLAHSEREAFDAYVRSLPKDAVKDRATLLMDKRTVGEKVIDFYNSMGSAFKFGKVAASPSAIVNAFVGNPMMYFAAGGDLSQDYLNSLFNAYKIVSNKAAPETVFKLLLNNDDLLRTALKYPNYFKGTFGAGLTDIAKNMIEDTAVREGLAAGILKAGDDVEDFKVKFDALKKELQSAALKYQKEGVKKSLTQFKLPSKVIEEELAKGFVPRAQNWSSFELTNEEANYFNKLRQKVQERADAGDSAAWVLNKMTNDMAKLFEKTDQIAKLGTAIHMTQNGLTLAELDRMAKVIPITKADLVNVNNPIIKNGTEYFRVNWEKSMDAANEIYMNYAAMPTAVRVMRSVPLLNSPFISFSYAMLPKFAKTLVHNPAAFTKMNFAMQEFQGTKTPLERKALEDKYYNWYNSPGMVRLPNLPFFGENPIYMNIASMNPFYSMSIGAESKRKYKDSTLEQVAATLDKLGLFQNPVAQVIKDYGILPALMARGEVPQGQFGQVLYPQKATALDRLGYAGRAVADAYVPNVFGIAGGAAAGALMPRSLEEADAVKYLPTYQARKIANAMMGKTSIGVPKKGARLAETVKAAASTAGLPIYEMNTAYVASEAKKKKK